MRPGGKRAGWAGGSVPSGAAVTGAFAVEYGVVVTGALNVEHGVAAVTNVLTPGSAAESGGIGPAEVGKVWFRMAGGAVEASVASGSAGVLAVEHAAAVAPDSVAEAAGMGRRCESHGLGSPTVRPLSRAGRP